MLDLKVMTYNIQGHAATRRPDHVPKLAEVIAAASPDIVGLQEVHCRTRAFAGHQADQLARLTGLTPVFGRSCAMDGGEYGNAVLTRANVVRSHVHALPGSGEPRSLLQADVELEGAVFSFFVTHLAAWGRLLRVSRLRQIAELGDITARGSLPHILVGDLNITPATEEMRVLLSHGHLRMCGEQREATFPMTRQRLDYVFCDAAWEYRGSEVIRRGPSDHWPILTEMRLQGAGE
ncbi:MAG TPA: endonuclease/exonuclease/phosphatase family protein [Thermoanaerobaculia bacterium]|nr:endonuclease/exonuclease/phosphatase family protein [Thermoanaerobaculia bacterium]